MPSLGRTIKSLNAAEIPPGCPLRHSTKEKQFVPSSDLRQYDLARRKTLKTSHYFPTHIKSEAEALEKLNLTK